MTLSFTSVMQTAADVSIQIENDNLSTKKSINLSSHSVDKGGFPLIQLQTINKRWSTR